MSLLGVPLVKARKLVDRLRSVEADNLATATAQLAAARDGLLDPQAASSRHHRGADASAPPALPALPGPLPGECDVRSPAGRRSSQVDLRGVLEALSIGHLEAGVVGAAGGRDLADLVR